MSDGPYSARDTGEKEHGINWFDLVGPNVNVGDNVGDSLSVKQMAKYANIGYAACQSQLAEANERVKELTERAERAEKLAKDLPHLVIMSDGSSDAMALFRYSDQAGEWVRRNYEGRCAIVPVVTHVENKEAKHEGG